MFTAWFRPMAWLPTNCTDQRGSFCVTPTTILKDDVELMLAWVDRLWLLLEERRNFGPGTNRERARQIIQQARRYYEQKLSEAR